ncbi:MAG: diacylglycerol kinase family protein [bacterium]|nr:diacylglycerol kinase family protein [bacterium]
MFSHFRLLQSFRYALRGLIMVWREEQNFRVQSFSAVAAFALAWYFHITRTEWFFLVLVSLIVLVLELLNTIFERFTDFFSPRLQHIAATIKDVMAAAVLMASLGAFVIGVLIFWPYIFRN